ncbi:MULTISPECIES: flagellar brake protein [Carboxydocella]|uniref:C-di-GMP-binding flagellar brake protein YcgR, contains PilZNR and PilZ domains n=2 Tax=Carboxydocella TaxID=178898 RepID=A0A1T4P955_9FIRM|nr:MULTISPECIES: flagellar brake domain-containing protein [Carboxydocella]AVX20750.1 c-di-GMP-binding flagellar brake protein YcgR [Carboxydocella thermautotrophica]AVX31169.1 c-di-GMP-binding flagellar brake protein YcgR [Carboxydocella thermautotrophica]SJZ88002.1 c-di-GMP-binding flagellar brake protein YcgR, contains PilZNR and PilZ domains [Carboxydocella sporoproducens DSM 16521]GAW28279.1 flagellar brake protein [Carboxydocella sp. ULO1]GAW32150.1 flagellar brake protein [Carboxydocell
MAVVPQLSVNQNVEIELLEENLSGVYRSRVEEIAPDRIILALPFSKGVPVPVRVGSQILVRYFDQSAIYSFKSEVISRATAPQAILSISIPESVNRVQRRNYVRLDDSVPLTFYKLQEDDITGTDTVTKDISGGGVRIEIPQPLELGTELELHLKLPKDKIIAVGKVVRCLPLEKPKKGYNIGIQFTIIEERDRDKIIKYIFDRQRELRKKGLL